MYLTEERVRERAEIECKSRRVTARRALEEASTEQVERNQHFDIFLSHSSAEPDDILLGVFATLQDAGLSVYVDKFSDPQLSPNDVSRDTADLLRHRMRSSSALLYIHSIHSSKSRWMPWELGFFDGHAGRVGIIPVIRGSASDKALKGNEYVGLYPVVEELPVKNTGKKIFWIMESRERYAPLVPWIRGEQLIRSHAS